MAAPAYQSQSDILESGGSDTASCGVPSGTASGDLLVRLVAWSNRTLSTSPAASGWTQVFLDESTAVSPRIGAWWKIAGGSESAENWQWSGTVNVLGSTFRLANAGGFPANPLDDADSTAVTTTSPHQVSAPISTTTGADRLILRLAAYQANRTITVPAGLSPARFNSKIGTGSSLPGLAIGLEEAQAAAGNTSAHIWAWNAATNVLALTLAVYGNAGGGPSPVASFPGGLLVSGQGPEAYGF